jgi:hypothetical protein
VPVEAYVTDKVERIEAQLLSGKEARMPFIVVAEDRDASHVILDGHGRATAYHRVFSTVHDFEVIAGYSPDLPAWNWY